MHHKNREINTAWKPGLNIIFSKVPKECLVDVIICGSVLEKTDYDEGFSDIDIIVIIRDTCDVLRIDALLRNLMAPTYDITVYDESSVIDGFLKGTPFFGSIILSGKSVLNSDLVMDLRSNGFKFTNYAIFDELSYLATVIGRVLVDVKKENIIAIANRAYHIAKYGLATALMIKYRELIVDLKDIVDKAEKIGYIEEVRELIRLRNKRENIRDIHLAIRYLNETYGFLQGVLSEYCDFIIYDMNDLISIMEKSVYTWGILDKEGIILVYMNKGRETIRICNFKVQLKDLIIDFMKNR